MNLTLVDIATLTGIAINILILLSYGNKTERRFTILEMDMSYVKATLGLKSRKQTNALDNAN